LICEKGIPGRDYWVGSGEPKRLREYVERMYALYPSGKEMQFGKFPYNDLKLNPEDFSISNLVNDTGYAPSCTYEEIVVELYNSLISN
jgi:nucleoside-diphosphate-sugar epimerase